MKFNVKHFLGITFLFVVGFLPTQVFAEDSVYEPVPAMNYPSDNKWSKAKEELGKMLYFDPRLSGSNWISCATCHNPALGWSDGLPRTIGNGQKELGRHSPTVINSGFFTSCQGEKSVISLKNLWKIRQQVLLVQPEK